MRTISALSDVEEMMHCIIKTTTSLVAADRVTMYLVDESAQVCDRVPVSCVRVPTIHDLLACRS